MDQDKIKKQNHKMELMTQDELCAYLRKSTAWAERSRFEGTGPRFVRAGRKPLYPIEWITEWLLESASDNTVNV